MKKVHYILLVGIALAGVIACGESHFKGDDCTPGSLDCACGENWSCNFGLTCIMGVCVVDSNFQPEETDSENTQLQDTAPNQTQDTDTGQVADSDTGAPQDSDTGLDLDFDTGTMGQDVDTETYVDTDTEAQECHSGVQGWDGAFAKKEETFLKLLNQKRQQGATCGGKTYGPQGALQMQPNIRCANRFFVYDVAHRNYNPSDHDMLAQCELGATSEQRAISAGFEGTNLGGGYAAGNSQHVSTAEDAFNFFMDIENYCNKFMNESAKYIGVGYGYFSSGSVASHYWSFSTGKD